MREYSEKELVIFGGVFRLARQGVNLADITARQIAEAAGVGKATIYDYFSSKEEILVSALVYALESQIAATNNRLAVMDSFKKKIMYVYNEIIDKSENSLSVFNLFISMRGSETIQSYFRDSSHCRAVADIVARIEETIRGVINYGRRSGEITATDKDYIYMTVTATVFTVGRMRTEKRLPREKICENAYTMLIKALN